VASQGQCGRVLGKHAPSGVGGEVEAGLVLRVRGWVRHVVAPGTVPGRVRRCFVWAAGASAALLIVLVLLAFSPLLRIRTVSWTGPLRLSEASYRALEEASLGRPLFLVSERALGRTLGLDNRAARLELRRHLPATLEVNLMPRKAIALLDDETPIDAGGRRLAAQHALPGLPHLVGFELDPSGKRLQPHGRELLATLHRLLDVPALCPSEIRLEERELDLVLADTGTRVRLDPAALEPQILKLRVFEESLGSDPLPGSVDLRFQDQIVVREKGTGNARRRSR
jgi:cell division protein FtsQ